MTNADLKRHLVQAFRAARQEALSRLVAELLLIARSQGFTYDDLIDSLAQLADNLDENSPEPDEE